MERRERDREEVCLLAFFVFSLFCRFCRCVFWLVSYFHYFAALLTSKLFHSFLQRGEREAHAGSYNRAREASNAAARRCLFVSNCVGPRNQKSSFRSSLSLLSLLFLVSSFIKKTCDQALLSLARSGCSLSNFRSSLSRSLALRGASVSLHGVVSPAELHREAAPGAELFAEETEREHQQCERSLDGDVEPHSPRRACSSSSSGRGVPAR